MEYLKKRMKFLLIIIFSVAIILFVQYEINYDKNLDFKKVGTIMTILKIAAGGYGLYGLVQFFRVK
ncbi:hypothetical protein COSHB9_10400 [Companilactobacillus alimentarius]|uniref:Uncharacterized protein n=1 Tax=Companilactobacillus alimentarius DSM 20249 TaxID=1423720 RepID=A0A2K9HHU9_9LACO|nr:hypothetical protein [Companilactobacillus alimentarius]AUI72124.1 hypothetical protein LA20249_07995 [Companilactobacillus alimentarius DSM 20249]KRK78082.1 hypothetical protein FC67_GL001418 [Companilactobacillus alimentarius DSM 20249]MDT6952662.1 hypothetical protein [Companilactobacillus alimentarius]GEO44902.1 hypothetical protein LAL01_11340 [Companilactobacillus alimentarius]